MARKANKTYSITQAADLCGINRITLWRWIKSGKLAAYQTPSGHYRIKPDDFKRFIRRDLPFVDLDIPQVAVKVLVIDDDEQFRTFMRHVLSTTGFKLDEAKGGFEAGQKLLTFRPDLVILDLFMPDIDGFDICRRIKSSPHTRDIKILAVTGRGAVEVRQKIIELGADAFLEKPIHKKDLMECIRDLL